MGISILYETKGQDVALALDAVLRESHKGSAKVTRHPVEKGVAITDHVQDEPDVLSVTGAVSEVSLDGQSVARIARALDLLSELKSSGDLVTVATPHRTYENMKMTDYEGSRDPSKGGRLDVSMTFEFVRIVESQTVKVIAKKSPGRAKGKVDDGKQVATEAPDQAVRKSAAAKLVDGDFNFFGGQ